MSQLYLENLPDGIHDVLVSRHGGLFITGFDSWRRVCLVLYANAVRQVRTVVELPYREYGRYTPSVLAAHDPLRMDHLYVLLYQHPDNLGVEQMALYRLDVVAGRQVLLTASSSPFWAPTALLPRSDGSVLVALGGLGALLQYGQCSDDACDPAVELNTTASNSPGKGGLAEVDGMLCLVVDSTPVLSEGGRIVCELADGSLARVNGPSAQPSAASQRRAGGSSSDTRDSGTRDSGTGDSGTSDSGTGDSSTSGDDDGTTRDGSRADAFSDSSGRYPRRLAANSSACATPGATSACKAAASSSSSSADDSLAWLAPRRVRNPSILTTIPGDGSANQPTTLYVVSRDAVNEYGYAQGSVYALARRYDTFDGDVLAFCARGKYDCAAAQNSGECACVTGYGGSCCDIDMSTGLLGVVALVASSAPVSIAVLGAVILAALLYRLVRKPTAAASGTMRNLEWRTAALHEQLYAEAAQPTGALGREPPSALSSPHAAPAYASHAYASCGAVDGFLGARVTTPDVASSRGGVGELLRSDLAAPLCADDRGAVSAASTGAGGGEGGTAPSASSREIEIPRDPSRDLHRMLSLDTDTSEVILSPLSPDMASSP